ncbi:MAG TPA: sigma-70 family RNA polymerase sigma factor [Thermoanaerobaculia bacterium]|nr:sigma-70 family RNA polymerase sigma factor [Thermoanaerobaculia bacterium]
MVGELVEVSTDRETLPCPRPASLPGAPPSYGRALLEQHFQLIRQRLDRLSRFSGLPEHEAEELCSWALFKLVENDYRVLASWEGRSSFSAFLTVVLVNLMRDYRNHVWGKWKPSAAARRRGPAAVLMERLCVRDRLPVDEAIERMRTEHGVSLPRTELERMVASLDRRILRRQVREEELLRIPVDGQVEERIEDCERALLEDQLRELLAPLLQSLPADDRLLLRLHYWDGLSLAVIALALGRPQRELYSARDKCLRKLRRNLVEAGLSADQVRRLIGCSRLDLVPDGL